MKFDPTKHHRQSIRLKNYDYSQAGAYFVTICTHERECLFGDVVEDEMHLTVAGEAVQSVWQELSERFPSCVLDLFVVMPNHLHGIIVIDAGGAAQKPHPALGAMMRVFKSLSGIQVNRLLGRSGTPLWQRNYYERIIRDEDELNASRQYILYNPAKWAIDRENPSLSGAIPLHDPSNPDASPTA